MPDSQIFKASRIFHRDRPCVVNVIVPYNPQATYSGIPVYEMYVLAHVTTRTFVLLCPQDVQGRRRYAEAVRLLAQCDPDSQGRRL